MERRLTIRKNSTMHSETKPSGETPRGAHTSLLNPSPLEGWPAAYYSWGGWAQPTMLSRF